MPDDQTLEIPHVSEQELLNGAREQVDAALVLAAAETELWAKSLHAALAQLSAAYQRHSDAAEGPGGTLDVVMEKRPGLEKAVRIQRREHADLQAEINEIRDRLAADIANATVDPGTFRWQVAPVQDAVRRHMARANDLLFEAFTHDEGGEG